ncbi:B-cell scaffold protein with ankyrin repeats-like isoform X1 [Carcharodon carcharias]|uniref:B-cell scaffold protein with ankyrin repeats-like isoform X1 n=1 Tax=Carcharodon carcharias TaxID=13397 RepID=UPI001B7EBC1C|nr:B-cell scaffold protein with ankyrin repeats-like isoform X1 [Carcharodon carcharias]XP_041055765.1 B-cell scaffold protein with ankyrin repeats-like isoform X1 [Carcharodon carcharias]
MKRSETLSTDLAILYTEEAEEWNAYLKQIFLEALNPQSICSYKVGCLNDLRIATPNLVTYRCKLLVLTPGFLTALTTSKRIQLGKILQPPGEVVVLLCGVPNSDELYKLVPAERGVWELSSDQDAQEYLSVVSSIINSGPTQQQADLVGELSSDEANIPEDERSDSFIEPSAIDCQQDVNLSEDPIGESDIYDTVTVPMLAIPNRIQCKNPGEIYMLLKDGLSFGENPEIEFLTVTEKVRVQPTIWNSQTLCVEALDLPAGPVTMNLYGGGVRIAQAEVIYYSPLEEVERLLIRTADPIEFICQAFQLHSKDQLDQLLTQSLRNSLPPSGFGAFQNLGPNDRTEHNNLYCDHEFPTLLHFAAKNGLEKLTTLLLECPGAFQASTVLNTCRENPRDLAEKNGFQHIQELLDRFTVSTKRHQWVETFPDDCGVRQPVDEEEENIYEMMAQCYVKNSKECLNMEENEKVTDEEDPYTLTVDAEDPYDLILPEDKKESTANMVKRPPAPIPRPTTLQCMDSTPFIAQVFQQKTGKGIEDKLYSVPKRAARPKIDESPMYDTFRTEYNPGQQQLIHLQEQVKKGALTVDEAQEKFKRWQMEQKDQDAVQQEKLRKLRENIIKNRHDVEDIYDKLKIIHFSDDANTKDYDNMPAARGQVAGLNAKLTNIK